MPEKNKSHPSYPLFMRNWKSSDDFIPYSLCLQRRKRSDRLDFVHVCGNEVISRTCSTNKELIIFTAWLFSRNLKFRHDSRTFGLTMHGFGNRRTNFSIIKIFHHAVLRIDFLGETMGRRWNRCDGVKLFTLRWIFLGVQALICMELLRIHPCTHCYSLQRILKSATCGSGKLTRIVGVRYLATESSLESLHKRKSASQRMIAVYKLTMLWYGQWKWGLWKPHVQATITSNLRYSDNRKPSIEDQ
jgi:hypothetical protein